MAESRKPRRAPAAPTPAKTETKAATEFRRFQEARAAAGAESGSTSTGSTGNSSTTGTPLTGLPPWPSPPSFSLPQMPQGWAGMLPQPGMVQPAPLAVGPLGDRLGSTLRLGIDVINMALAGSLRLLGGGGWGGQAQCHGGYHDYHGHHGYHGYHGGCCDPCGGHDCCEVFEHEGCCNPSVGTCCD